MKMVTKCLCAQWRRRPLPQRRCQSRQNQHLGPRRSTFHQVLLRGLDLHYPRAPEILRLGAARELPRLACGGTTTMRDLGLDRGRARGQEVDLDRDPDRPLDLLHLRSLRVNNHLARGWILSDMMVVLRVQVF